MTKPNDFNKRPAKTKKDKHEVGPIPILRVKKGATLKEVYAAGRRAFSAADLQKFTEIEEGIPAEQVLAELEAVDREEILKRKRKSNGRSR